MNVQCHACIGGTNVGEDIRKLDYGQHVVAGTPGRVFGERFVCDSAAASGSVCEPCSGGQVVLGVIARGGFCSPSLVYRTWREGL